MYEFSPLTGIAVEMLMIMEVSARGCMYDEERICDYRCAAFDRFKEKNCARMCKEGKNKGVS